MRVYISGDLQGPPDIIKQKISDAEDQLRGAGLDPVNPMESPNRFETLKNCEGIYLLTDWLQSAEAMTEKYYSTLTGKKVIFQTQELNIAIESKDYQAIIEKISGAIEEITGLKLSDYSSGPRYREDFFCRMIFAYQCKKAGLEDEQIRQYISRDRTTILHYFKQYEIDFGVTAKFRSIARLVDEKIYPEVYQCNTFISK